MNDPNGMVFLNGKYHLFYQYYPGGIVWGPMHWGHAESTDLIHWKQLPIALYPDEKGYIFSGSAVIDKDNTAGFGINAMIAIFTYHSDELWKQGHKNTESQALAYSLDEGKTWTKYSGNPVLNNTGEQDFRDPKVFWNEQAKKWTMVLAVHDMIRIFTSPNLKNWSFESNFKPKEDFELGVWECPDLFPIRYKDQQKWVMLVSHGYEESKNAPHGTRYFIGNFDGKTFTPETPGKWIDSGSDFYAAVTFGNVPDDKKILLGWMSNWAYATKTPTEVWRSAMTLPRGLTLDKDKSGWFLRQEIVSNLSDSKDSFFTADEIKLPVKQQLPTQGEVVFQLGNAKDFVVELKNNSGEVYKIELKIGKFSTDRTKSGKTDFSDKFAVVKTMSVGETVSEVRILIDKSSVEILLNEGKFSMTDQIFPLKDYDTVTVSSNSVKEIYHLDINSIQSIWRN